MLAASQIKSSLASGGNGAQRGNPCSRRPVLVFCLWRHGKWVASLDVALIVNSQRQRLELHQTERQAAHQTATRRFATTSSTALQSLKGPNTAELGRRRSTQQHWGGDETPSDISTLVLHSSGTNLEQLALHRNGAEPEQPAGSGAWSSLCDLWRWSGRVVWDLPSTTGQESIGLSL